MLNNDEIKSTGPIHKAAMPPERPQLNFVVLHGALARPPEIRTGSNARFMAIELNVRARGRRTETVPVVFEAPPDDLLGLDTGDQVLVTGRVRRRYFRYSGTLQTRTEVVADQVVPREDAISLTEVAALGASPIASVGS